MPDGQAPAKSEGYTGVGQFDNTLIIFVCGDNGMSAEGSLNSTPNEVAYYPKEFPGSAGVAVEV